MPSYQASKDPKTIEISNFLGLNTSIGQTEIKVGEAIEMLNYRITKNYKLQKRRGHSTWWDFENSKDVQGLWYGTLNGIRMMIACNDGKVYARDLDDLSTSITNSDLITDGAVVQIGTITDAKTSITFFKDKVYFLNGTDYKQYDGITYQDVVAYVPTVTLETPPTGGGTLFEEINLLTGKFEQAFIGNGTATIFQLALSGLDATVVTCTINGVTKVETTDFTVNRTLGTVTFTTAPANESDVRLRPTKTVSGNADLIKNNRYAVTFGPSNDTNLFIFGNVNEKNTYRVSGTEKPNYFPANSFYKVSTNDFAITDLVPQYDRLIVFKEDRTHYTYSQVNPLYEANTGLNQYIYPSFDLNKSVGNICEKGVQLIENNPVSLNSKSVWKWSNTQVADERNASIISDRIKELLLEEDLSNAITFDYQIQKELWINVHDLVYIYNYGNDTWYMYDNIEAKSFLDVADYVHYASTGKVEKFDNTLNDNGIAIKANWKSGFIDFGAYEYNKNSRNLWISIDPASRTSVNIKCPTNRVNEDDPSIKQFNVSYVLIDFDNIDFDDFSFSTNRNPQVKRIKIKAKKYNYIQFIFTNEELDETLVIISFKVDCEVNNLSK